MKEYTVLFTFLFLSSFCNISISQGILVQNIEEFNQAVKQVQPGDIIKLSNGVWKDVELVFTGNGTAFNPITLSVEEKGKVTLEGQSNIRIAGEYLVVEGLVFRNGHTPTSEVISFKRNKEYLANHCRVTQCVVDNYNPAERFDSDYWVGIYGKNNRFDHNYLVGKRNQGVTLAVRLNSTESRENHHRIDHNYFGYHQIMGANGGETLRIGTSHYSLSNSNTVVEYNYFERCSGEHEIISNKSCQNTFRNNTFYECQGTLTMRHGNETLVEDNYFFGNGKANTGGVRIINESQTVRNNYCESLTGYRFRGALVIMNGVPNSPPNRYFQVKDSEASNNTFINCDYIQLCAGSDEERSAVPIDTKVENNLIYHDSKNEVFTVFDDISGISFTNNILSKNIKLPENKGKSVHEGFENKSMEAVKESNGLYVIPGFENEGFKATSFIPGPNNTGPNWYAKNDYQIRFNIGELIEVKSGENTILDALKMAKEGDIIELVEEGNYHATKAIDIEHTVTIRAKSTLKNKPKLSYERRSLFNIENGGSLKLKGLIISGKACDDMTGNTVIRTSRYSMINNYKLILEDCIFSDLDVNHSFDVFRVFKNTFADSIVMRKCIVNNITGHVMALNKEIDDIGIYNAENVLFSECVFNDIGGVVLNLHRGGKDESTFGPMLEFTDCSLNNVGHNKRNKFGSAISLHGVQLANLENLSINESKKIDLHLIVGEPVIKLSNLTFVASEGYETNDDRIITSNIILNKE